MAKHRMERNGNIVGSLATDDGVSSALLFLGSGSSTGDGICKARVCNVRVAKGLVMVNVLQTPSISTVASC